MDKLITTLCIIEKESQILLGMKKRGFGQGRWDGFGGKIEPGETFKEAIVREVQEEAGIKILDPREIGEIIFEFKEEIEVYPVRKIEAKIFKAHDFLGKPQETEEMRPRWFSKKAIPYQKMWPDDKYWFPYFLKNKNFQAYFLFRNTQEIINYQINDFKHRNSQQS